MGWLYHFQPMNTVHLVIVVVAVVQSLSCVWLFATQWFIALQAPLSMGFPRQEYWSRLPLPPPGDLPRLGIEPASPALAGRFFTTEAPGKPSWLLYLSQWTWWNRKQEWQPPEAQCRQVTYVRWHPLDMRSLRTVSRFRVGNYRCYPLENILTFASFQEESHLCQLSTHQVPFFCNPVRF